MSVMHGLEQHIPFKDLEFVAVYFTAALVLAFLIVYAWNKILRLVDPDRRQGGLH